MKLVAHLNDIPDGRFLRVEVDGEMIALHRSGPEVFAIAASCPHRGGPLDEGEVEDGVVNCPWHGWAFDVRTGRCVVPEGCRPQKVWDVHVIDSEVHLDETSGRAGDPAPEEQ